MLSPTGRYREYAEIPVADIALPAHLMRQTIDPVEFEELKASIAEVGLLQPIVVNVRGETIELVAGYRRFRAVCELGWETVPAIVISEAADIAALAQAAENVQRANLNPIEEGEFYRHLMDTYGLTMTAIAAAIGKSREYVSERVRILQEPPELVEAVREGIIPLRCARYLSKITDPVYLAQCIAWARQGGITEEAARRWAEDWQRAQQYAAEVAAAAEKYTPPEHIPAPEATAPPEPEIECAVCRRPTPVSQTVTLQVCEECIDALIETQTELDAAAAAAQQSEPSANGPEPPQQ